MHIIIGIVLLLIFYGAAPRFLKWLLTIDIAAILIYFILLRICALIIGGGKGGRNSGALADYVMPMIYMGGAGMVIFALGLIAAIATFFAKRNHKGA